MLMTVAVTLFLTAREKEDGEPKTDQFGTEVELVANNLGSPDMALHSFDVAVHENEVDKKTIVRQMGFSDFYRGPRAGDKTLWM